MSEVIEASDASIVPDCFMSSNKYASYLWLGHCIFNPSRYEDALRSFHDDDQIFTEEAARFESQLDLPAEKLLLPLLERVIHSAHLELGESLPRNTQQCRRLQVYLVGEVSVRGMNLIKEEGWLSEAPEIAQIRSPFKDGALIDKMIRYSRSKDEPTKSENYERLTNYSTIERLLPGYPVATSEE